MEKRISVKLNGARLVSGRLRGYDHFMNIVLDESVEEAAPGSAPGAGGEQRDIGLVVRRRRVGGAARSQPRFRPPPPPSFPPSLLLSTPASSFPSPIFPLLPLLPQLIRGNSIVQIEALDRVGPAPAAAPPA